MRKVMIIGATSAIARETARLFAEKGDALYLVGRQHEKLDLLREDLAVRNTAQVVLRVADMLDFDQHPELIKDAHSQLGGLDLVLIAHGTLSDQDACQKEYAYCEKELQINFLSIVSLLTDLANYFEAQKSGTIAVISSVAGDRGRQSNYVYGTAKAAVSTLLQGLRNRLQPAGVHVLTIKPGFVDTPMTAHLKKGPLFASAQSVAKGIDRAINRKRNIVYLPWFWQFIMLIIKLIPEAIFKRLKM